jgi:signal transduction histidine kinase
MPTEDEKLLEVKQLKSLLEAEKQEFLSVMSHELRTPMTGVKGYLSMILEGDAGEIPPRAREYLAQAYVANDRLIRLVDKMLKIARIQDQNFQFNLGKVDLNTQVQQVVNDCKVRAQEKKIELTYEPSGQYFVYGDPDRSREVLLTMVINAIKFTNPSGRIKLTHRRTPNWIITDVTDTGIGIKKEDQERLFELFSKANLTLANQEHGTGAGLFLARHLAEGQEGRLWLEHSEMGVGSTFSFALKEYEGQ